MSACSFCNADLASDELGSHESVCSFNPRRVTPSATVTAFRRFAQRLTKKAHETADSKIWCLSASSLTIVATAILCVANEARDFADELEKEGWGQ